MVSRQELYELVWSSPMTTVAKQFEVSSSYLARVCAALNVPRPGRGYWAKLVVDAAPPRIPLREPHPGDQLSWEPGGELSPAANLRRPQKYEGDRQSRSQVRTHWLITSARQHFDNSRPIEDGDYLKPYKKLLVDITSSKACLEKAFGFASTLFNALEAAGHRVMVASNQGLYRIEINEHEARSKQQRHRYPSIWTPRAPTVVYIEEVAIGLAIIEMSEDVLMRYVNGKYVRDADYKSPKASRHYVDRTWTTTQSLPSGRLRLVAYCPSWRVSWTTEWQETPKSPLESSLRAILKTIGGSAVTLAEKLAEAKRVAEAERLEHLAVIERHEREEDRRKIAESIKDSHQHLAQIIQQWASVKSVEQFLLGVEESVAKLSDEEKKAAFERLSLARQLLGSVDPMRFFLNWKTPSERYQSRYVGNADDKC
ncbi:hypothetical protein GIW81_06135 [Hyphomicrobium sp. xq]|uniref:Uncharacterized protein n=1 Tax=Hyphomicrobium album TaxID=2665159 RepID=A0A6I3KHQ6_9HYPH|nr:hypothetical protein [Hyphomicrobium album]MTD93913.1 hypothetical protein [Hyphomicrobium album]